MGTYRPFPVVAPYLDFALKLRYVRSIKLNVHVQDGALAQLRNSLCFNSNRGPLVGVGDEFPI